MVTIHLQGLGECPAIPASELKTGMKISWNYSFQKFEIISIKDVSACFIEIVTKHVETGMTHPRRLKKDRLVACNL